MTSEQQRKRSNRHSRPGLMWLCLVPALLFGNLSVLAPLRLSHLGWGAAAVGGTYLVMGAVEATWAPILGRASDRYGRFPPLRRSP